MSKSFSSSDYHVLCFQTELSSFYSRKAFVYRLKKEFKGRLSFHRASNPSHGDIVTSSNAVLTDLVPDTSVLTNTSSLLSEVDTASSCDEEIPFNSVTQSNQYQLNQAAMSLRMYIDQTKTVEIPWPPTADNLNAEACVKFVPPPLFNFLAMMTGHADIVCDWNTYYDLDASVRLKILSLAQDIVQLSSKGASVTPKSLAIGLTVRHMTGSKLLAKLIHGFGHSCSYDSIIRLETALALKQAANTAFSLPAGFLQKNFTMLVYDNIDFSEETLSGHGTTHHTNGLMIQLRSNTPATSVEHTIPRNCRKLALPSTEIAPYFLSTKQGPNLTSSITPQQADVQHPLKRSITNDRTYIARKSLKLSPETLPGWTAYNILNSEPLPVSIIHYLPVIEASPTQLSTVNHILESALAVVEKLQCESVMVVMDQAIYSKAQQIRWCRPELQSKLALRLGEFHTAMCFLSAIGKRFALSGLEDILVESEVVALGSMKGVLSGHCYNRSMRAHKQLFEALSRMQFSSFLDSLEEKEADLIAKKVAECDGDAIPDEVCERLEEFILQSSSSSLTFRFWQSYLDMMMTLLAFIRATRTSDWDLHLSSLRDMLPWMFAYDRTNYSR